MGVSACMGFIVFGLRAWRERNYFLIDIIFELIYDSFTHLFFDILLTVDREKRFRPDTITLVHGKRLWCGGFWSRGSEGRGEGRHPE